VTSIRARKMSKNSKWKRRLFFEGGVGGGVGNGWWECGLAGLRGAGRLGRGWEAASLGGWGRGWVGGGGAFGGLGPISRVGVQTGIPLI
jgi:hypothetical protein